MPKAAAKYYVVGNELFVNYHDGTNEKIATFEDKFQALLETVASRLNRLLENIYG